MKTNCFLLLLVLFIASGVKAQDQTNVVKINPLGAVVGAAQVSYEKALNESSSFLISPSFGFFKSGGFKYTTVGVGAEYRFYFSDSHDAPAGFYAGPGVGFTFGTAKFDFSGMEEGEDDKTNITGLTAKGIIGYQWIFDSGFTLDLNGGIQYINLKFKDKSGAFANATAFSGILPALGFSIGYAF